MRAGAGAGGLPDLDGPHGPALPLRHAVHPHPPRLVRPPPPPPPRIPFPSAPRPPSPAPVHLPRPPPVDTFSAVRPPGTKQRVGRVGDRGSDESATSRTTPWDPRRRRPFPPASPPPPRRSPSARSTPPPPSHSQTFPRPPIVKGHPARAALLSHIINSPRIESSNEAACSQYSPAPQWM